MAGFGGCNQYHANWAVEGASLTLGAIGATRKSCGTTVDDAESTYLGALQAATGFAVAGTGLTITSSSGITLEYQAAGGPPSSPAPTAVPTPEASSAAPSPGASAAVTGDIVGSWQMTEFAGTELPGGLLDVSIIFAADGTFSGNGGCNDYSGSWKLEGTKLAMSDLVPATGGTCDATTQSIEQGYFTLIPYLDSATITDGKLTLLSSFAPTSTFVFEPAT